MVEDRIYRNILRSRDVITQPKKLRCIRYLNLIDIKGETLKGRRTGGEMGRFCSNRFKFLGNYCVNYLVKLFYE